VASFPHEAESKGHRVRSLGVAVRSAWWPATDRARPGNRRARGLSGARAPGFVEQDQSISRLFSYSPVPWLAALGAQLRRCDRSCTVQGLVRSSFPLPASREARKHWLWDECRICSTVAKYYITVAA
jgi:hypothetical protein